MTTIQERLAQKAAASIATGVANSENVVFGGGNAANPSASLSPNGPVVDPLIAQEFVDNLANHLVELGQKYTGDAYYQERTLQFVGPGGKFVRPDSNGVYQSDDPKVKARLEFYASKGVITKLKTKEQEK